MSLKVGDSVRVEGREGKIISRTAAGKHVRFVLDDGRVYVDLDKHSDASVTTPAEAQQPDAEYKRQRMTPAEVPVDELPSGGWEYGEDEDDEENEEEASDTDS